VPYSPLGRGFLTGAITEATQFEEGDFRNYLARFSGHHAAMNHERLKIIETIATPKHCSMAQVALAWVLANSNGGVPIPGTKRIKYLEENVAAESIELTSSELALLDEAFPTGADYGPRYPAGGMRGIGE
jgi:aryl-alcohol dehydrogenase-like predicted oxidoreductase